MLGFRLDAKTERALEAFAKRTRRTKSQIAREAIETYLRRHDLALAEEARRQSLNARERGWSREDEAWEDIAAADDFDDPQ
jgi:predicted DNA-binding protein